MLDCVMIFDHEDGHPTHKNEQEKQNKIISPYFSVAVFVRPFERVHSFIHSKKKINK